MKGCCLIISSIALLLSSSYKRITLIIISCNVTPYHHVCTLSQSCDTTNFKRDSCGSKDLSLPVVELLGDIRRLQIEITINPDSLLFISSFLPWVSSQQVNSSKSRPQNRYADYRTRPYTCSSRCRATYIRIQALL